MKLRLGGRSGVVLTASATLAVAISACVTTFSAIDATLFRPLPFAEADRLVIISDRLTKLNIPDMPVAWAHYDEYRNQSALFERSAGFHPAEVSLSGESAAERVPALRVTADFLPLLGIQPVLGRNFRMDETVPGRDRLVLLSHSAWVSRYDADRRLLGGTLRVDGQPHLVIGILPEGFAFRAAAGPEPALYLPVAFEPTNVIRPPRLRILARLRDGITAGQAAESMKSVAGALAPRHQLYDGAKGAGAGYTIAVVPLRERLYGAIRTSTMLFAGAVALVLLIACGNVASLLLVDWQRRSRDVAVRQALGASRWQLASAVLREAFLISAAAAAVGTLAAHWLTRLLVHLGPPELSEVRVDWRALAFALALSIATTIAAGVVPALRAWHGNLADSLSAGRTVTGSRFRRRTLQLLVAGEVALAFVLLVGSALLMRSFSALHAVDLGFDDRGTITAQVSLPADRYRDPGQCASFFQRLAETLRANGELRDVSMATALPLMFGPGGAPFTILDRGFDAKAVPPQVAHNLQVDRSFLATFGIRLLAGRGIEESDSPTSNRVAVVNETMWRRYWPGESPVGKQIVMGGPRPNAPWMTIVGVVSDVRTGGPANPVVPQVYSPFVQSQFPVRSMMFVVRGNAEAIANAVGSIDADVALHDIRTMADRLALSTARPRLQTAVLGLFAAVAVIIALGGVAAVVAHGVMQRTREVGVRIAMGATRGQVLGLVVRDGMAPVAAGLAVGFLIAVISSDVLRGMLFGTGPLDSVSYSGAAAVFVIVAALACTVAARGVMKIDPIAALRVE